MAVQATYKKYKRGQRQANVETSFKSGMMFTEGTVLDGYVKTLVNFDFTQDGKDALKPRAALVTSEVLVPDMTEIEDVTDAYLSNDTAIKYSKECVEQGTEYRQFILGKPSVDPQGYPLDSGIIWVLTSEREIDDFEEVVTAGFILNPTPSNCAFYNTGLTEIHDVELVTDAKTSFPVGSFMGNSFYFFDRSSTPPKLRKTVFDTTNVPSKYIFADVDTKVLTASEAVNYGYNMLDDSPYTFEDNNNASSFIMEGILPYDGEFVADAPEDPELMMTPKANTRVWFRCNYNALSGNNYKIVWSWKEVSGTDDWTVFNNYYDGSTSAKTFKPADLPVLQADLVVPAKEIMVRCEAYNLANGLEDIVERAMTIGFDFSLDPESTTRNSKQENYDLSTATGMMSWRNRLVVWGLPYDPTIMFISDLDEPGYFPYPNNVTIFDEPIIAVTELMDSLIVFTHSKVYQVKQNEDGTSWNSEVIQSNLYIETWDKHLIQSVRNMVYFKSGNYYYMLVPKAQSTTGELTLAPITTPITDFFNHFRANISNIFRSCYKTIDEATGEVVIHDPTASSDSSDGLVTYYNFIDYEFVHNFYVFRYNGVYIHFDIIYSVVDRYWKINIYESAQFLYPFRNDATQTGLMASTSVHDVIDLSSGIVPEHYPQNRIIQLFKFNPIYVEDLYIPSDTGLKYFSTVTSLTVDEHTLIFPANMCTYIEEEERLTVPVERVRLHLLSEEWLWIFNNSEFINGFNKVILRDNILVEAAGHLRDITVFPNKQMLDTGYRDANPFINKRYRELQLQINDPDNVDMEFGMDFQIAGEPRNTYFLYEVSQVIDEMREDEGILYIDATPYLSIDSDKVDKINQWSIKYPVVENAIKVSLWKVRASISGKGVAPRLRLFTRGTFNYQLLGINWIYREMNMR